LIAPLEEQKVQTQPIKAAAPFNAAVPANPVVFDDPFVKYVDAMGTATGRSQFGHRIRFAATFSGPGAGTIAENSVELMVIKM
jgi:hypothetical protein